MSAEDGGGGGNAKSKGVKVRVEKYEVGWKSEQLKAQEPSERCVCSYCSITVSMVWTMNMHLKVSACN